MIENIYPGDWQFEAQQREKHPLLMADFWCEALYFKYPKDIDLDVRGLDYLISSENRLYYRKGQREVILDKFKERLIKDSKYLHYIFDGTKRGVKEFDDVIKSGSPDWYEFKDKFLNLVSWFYIPWYITEFNLITDGIVKDLEKYKEEIIRITDFNNATMVILFPDKTMGFQEEQELFYQLIDQLKDGREIHTDEYLNEFGWMNTFALVPTEPLSKEELREKLDRAIVEKSDETYKLQREKRKKDVVLVKKLEGIFASDLELNKRIKDARYLAWLLTWSVETAMKSFAKGIPWYKKIANSIGVKYEDWVYLSISEIETSLERGRSIVSDEEIIERKKANILSIVDGKVEIVSGNKAQLIIDRLNVEETFGLQGDIVELVGKSACPGKTKGVVKICYTAQDSHIVEDGDILVTAMTSPDYVPAMKRASAIVTDEGGLLCHAAIMSRELGKPCIIATKIATKVFKTGESVEIDADNGVIRKIQS